EQASGKLDQISARSDVYSLGAILYELITGKPPFGAANPWETIKQVLGNEPVSPRLLNNGVPVDLETICLKCLQKDQDRRYQSAQDLADELHRFLVGEPILARRIGLVERSTRWCYRNPWPTAALGVLLLAVVGISAGLVRARVAEAKAKASETRAVEAKDEADAAKIQAETSRDQAMKTINEFITAWGDVTLLNEPGFEDVRAELLATASKLYKQMGERLGQDPKIQHELGVSYFRLGRMMAHLRSYDDAREALEAGLKIQRELHAARPHDEERLHALGETLNQLGNVLDVVSASPSDEAEQKFEQAVNLVEDTVEARIKQSFEQAEAIYDEAIEARTRLVDVSPDNWEYQRQLLNAHMNVGLLRRRMADVLRDQEQFETADAYYAEAHSRFEQVQQQRRELLERLDPTSDVRQELVQDLAQCYYNMAYVMWWLGDFDATGEHATDAVRAFDALLAEDPDRLENQYDQALCLMLGGDAESEQMGQLLDSGNDAARQEAYDAALAAYGKAIATLERLASKSTSVPKYRRDLSQVYMRLGDLQLLAQQDQQALAAYQSAADKLQPLVAEFPAYQPLLDQANSNIAEAQQFINEAAGAPAPSAEGTE
ncbi:MAG: protein kinase, partial [Pirellulaceae bacterium]